MASEEKILPVEKKLRALAMSFPETHEDFPWGHRAWKVKKKAFVFCGPTEDGGFSMSVKLTASHRAALKLKFVIPTRYNLGKSGWITATFKKGEKPPVPVLSDWVRESYCAVAPKKLAAQLAT